jgi:hypothetical protein
LIYFRCQDYELLQHGPLYPLGRPGTVPRAYETFNAYNILLEKKSQNQKKTANFNLKYLFRYLNDKNNNLSRRVSQQPH